MGSLTLVLYLKLNTKCMNFQECRDPWTALNDVALD